LCVLSSIVLCVYVCDPLADGTAVTWFAASTILRQSLKCTRIYIHRNLFASFIINNAMWLLWYKCVADQPEVLLDNRVRCNTFNPETNLIDSPKSIVYYIKSYRSI
jgi:hypothetical protein